MSGINGDWYEALKGEFKKPYYKTLFNTVNEEYRTRQIFPPANDIFNAFHLTPLKDVKVVILGQDPYHNFNQAHGLCFSVKKGVQVPPSLVNIYKELQDDLGCTIPNHGCLTKWAEQGVLMLNTVLTVRAHQANSHRGIGWEEFTDAAIMAVNAQDRPVVFILWGAPAQRKKRMLNNSKHLILEAPHPSRCLHTGDFSEAGRLARPIIFWKNMALHQSTGRLSRAVRNSDIADSYDAKWLQLSRRAFLPDHSGKWVLFYYNLKKILINYQAEIFKFFYIM